MLGADPLAGEDLSRFVRKPRGAARDMDVDEAAGEGNGDEEVPLGVSRESRLGLYNNKKKNKARIQKVWKGLAYGSRLELTASATGSQTAAFGGRDGPALVNRLQKKREGKMKRMTKVRKARKHGLMNVKME